MYKGYKVNEHFMQSFRSSTDDFMSGKLCGPKLDPKACSAIRIDSILDFLNRGKTGCVFRVEWVGEETSKKPLELIPTALREWHMEGAKGKVVDDNDNKKIPRKLITLPGRWCRSFEQIDRVLLPGTFHFHTKRTGLVQV